jgi:hypothetical protein
VSLACELELLYGAPNSRIHALLNKHGHATAHDMKVSGRQEACFQQLNRKNRFEEMLMTLNIRGEL